MKRAEKQERTILHCDINGFYAAVECLFNPKLRDVPMAVAGDPKNRHGIILAKNELARNCDVKTAETIWQAKRKCPGLIFVPPRHEEYSKYSQLANEIYLEFTDLVEPFGIDESWLDVTHLLPQLGSGVKIADKIRETMKDRLGLTVSVGVSFNKIFAKMGSDYKKPDATTEINYQNFKQIIWPLPVARLLYVGKVTEEHLLRLGIHTIGQLAKADKNYLGQLLGKAGNLIHDYANGIDNSPVQSACDGRNIKSVGNGRTFAQDLTNIEDIRTEVYILADTVGRRLRKHELKASVISVMLKDRDFKTISRQKSLTNPTNLTREIADAAMDLIRSSWQKSKPLRSITVTGSKLIEQSAATEQLSFLDWQAEDEREKLKQLDQAVDKIRQRFGQDKIGPGGSIRHKDKGHR